MSSRSSTPVLSRRAWFLRRVENPRAMPRVEKLVRRRLRRQLHTERWLERVSLGRVPQTARLERWLVFLAAAVIAAAIASAMR